MASTGSDSSEEDDEFGAESPPLTEQIASILRRYPDGGQILKELLQNADDAGATEVRFLVDSRQHQTEDLYRKPLSEFQGAALYAWNDAAFQASDWNSIGKIDRSSKEEDAIKVGRFGLGFQSVFHITDLPMVVSRDSIGIIDPHKKCFPKSNVAAGRKVKLDKFLQKRDHGSCFDGIFELSASTKDYPYTLFRFPLRNEMSRSKISQTTYNTTKVKDNLFSSFKQEAKIILLFLKNVRKVSLYEWDEMNGQPRILYSIEVDESCSQCYDLLIKQREMCSDVARSCDGMDGNTVTVSTFTASFVEESNEGRCKKHYHWLLTNMIGTDYPELIKLGKELRVLPWVGVATALPSHTCLHHHCIASSQKADVSGAIAKFSGILARARKVVPWSDNDAALTTGQAFCFLPLPGTISLPVHVHGYFAVADNRRSIKWPAHDERGNQARWNELLMERMVAPAYATLLVCRSSLLSYKNTPVVPTPSPGSAEQATDPYAAWPLYSEVKNHPIWSALLTPTLKLASHSPILWTAAQQGKWVELGEAYFIPKESTCPNITIIESLISAGVPVVSLPKGVHETLMSIGFDKLLNSQTISPALLREFIRKKRIAHSEIQGKLLHCLLSYVLSDLHWRNYCEMRGIPLLPLMNKSKCEFEKPSRDNMKYFFPRDLKDALQFLPGIEKDVVDDSICCELEDVAKSRCLQLSVVTCKVICDTLLHKSVLSWCTHKTKLRYITQWQWTPGKYGHPPVQWLLQLWKWLCDKSANLEALLGLPIIPQKNIASIQALPCNSNIDLYELERNSKICILQEETRLRPVLESLGFVIIEYSSDIFRHPNIHNYLPAVSPELILKLIAEEPSVYLSHQNAHLLRKYFSRHFIMDVPEKYRKVLISLSIFEAGLGRAHVKLVALNRGIFILPPYNLPDNLDYPDYILSTRDPLSVQLLQNLGYKQKPLGTFLKDYLIPFASDHCRSKNKDKCSNGDQIIIWILQHGSEEICNCLKDKELIRCENNPSVLKCPGSLYDPTDAYFVDLFSKSECAFPDPKYNNVLESLRSLSLKTWRAISSNPKELCKFFIDRAKSIPNLGKGKGKGSNAVAMKRSQFLLQAVLQHSGNQELRQTAKQFPFLLAEPNPPAEYPEQVQWFPSSRPSHELYRIQFICVSRSRDELVTLANIVGGIKPIIDNIPVQVDVSDFFRPQVSDVLKQLALLVDAAEQEQAKGNIKYERAVYTIYQNLSLAPNIQFHFKSFPQKWIWWTEKGGGQFISPDVVFMRLPPGMDVSNLEPYLYCISTNPDLRKYKKLFSRCIDIHKHPNGDDLIKLLHFIQDEIKQKKADLSSRHLTLVITVLLWLQDSKEETRGILFPTESQQLVKAENCIFDDRHIPERSKVSGSTQRFTFVHERIPDFLAQYFHVKPLSVCLAPSQKLKIKYTRKGQHERITQRISRIVQDYATNIDIFKELIQNADDARATEVKFLIDWRNYPTSSTLTEKLGAWQGPALWAYNDATFSDQDLDYICRVAGETKKEDPTKTGQFGVGFCAVYRLTDIPTFVSRHSFTMFDPHTAYLGDRVSPHEPGIRINLVESKADLESYRDQFAPYDQIFGCNIFDLPEEGYQATLFRFPFRNKETADRSEISCQLFNKPQIDQLTKSFEAEAIRILLFLKHTRKISFHTLARGAESPSSMIKLFEVEASRDSQSSRVQLITDYKDYPGQKKCLTSKHSISSSSVSSSKTEIWMMSSAIGAGSSHELVSQMHDDRKGLVPLAEVAVQLKCNQSSDIQIPQQVKGMMYCFLPLPLQNGFAFHISGYFDVGKDRRSLSTAVDGTFGSKWNSALGEDALADAFINMLASLAENTTFQNPEDKDNFLDKYYSLWSLNNATGIVSKAMVQALKEKLQKTQKKILWSESKGGCWLSPMEAIMFEDANVRVTSDIYKDTIFLLILKNLPIVEACYEVRKVLSLEKYNYERFCTEVLFPEIKSLDRDLHHSHLIFLLDKIDKRHYAFAWAESLLISHDCIPCQGSPGLLPPKRLIDSTRHHLSCLFAQNEGRFPSIVLQKSDKAMRGLAYLDMSTFKLSSHDLKERAITVIDLAKMNPSAARERAYSLLKYVEYVYTVNPGGPMRYYHKHSNSTSNQELAIIRDISFLPVLKAPHDVDLPWHNSNPFVSPTLCYSPQHKDVVFSLCPVVELPSDVLSPSILPLIGVSKDPELSLVLKHFQCVINHLTTKEMTDATAKYLEKEHVMLKIYQYFHNVLKTNSKAFETVATSLSELQLIFQNQHFLHPQQVVIQWPHNCYPYLCELSEVNKDFCALFQHLGVAEKPSAVKLREILSLIEADYHDKPLSNDIISFVNYVCTKLASNGDEIGNSELYLPDEDKIMRPVSRLACDKEVDKWISEMGEDSHTTFFVNSNIPRDIAVKLGVRPLLDTIMGTFEEDGFLEGIDYGQHEDLCIRLNSILRKYPSDVSIFYEFIQNADDAKASEVVFVLDHRTNFLQEKLFSQEKQWKKLQKFPALCIYNNQKFTEEDIEGISNLGKGAKANSPEMIGRFGIGFNVSYHLTDCPSFVSFDRTGTPENFCIFDPTYSYVPRDKGKRKPGRRWKVNQKIASDVPDQFQPYLPPTVATLDQVENGHVVFRLPLTRHKLVHHTDSDTSGGTIFRGSYSLPSRRSSKSLRLGVRSFDVEAVQHLFKEFQTVARKSLLFLNHVKHVQVFEILENGEHIHHFSTRVEIPSPYRDKCLQFSSETKHKLEEMKSLKLPSTVSCFHEVHVTYTETKDDEIESNKWLVQKIFGMTNTDHQDLMLLGANEYGLTPLGGVAVQLGLAKEPAHHSVFCFLPTPLPSELPVHINGHFLLDDSRKHFEKVNKDDLEVWNETIAANVIAPAYAKLILEAKHYVQKLSNGIDWYYSIFPKVPNSTPLHQMWEAFFKILLSQKKEILLEKPSCLSTTDDLLQWLSPQKCLFCVDFVSNETKKNVHISKELEGALLALGMPITNAPDTIYECMSKVNRNYELMGRVDPEKVVSHLECIQYSRGPLYDVMKDNCQKLLQYLFSGCKVKHVRKILIRIPLLLASDMSFQRTDQIFESRFARLLPNCAAKFINKDIECSSVGELLKLAAGVIVPLSINFVAQKIELEHVNSPVVLSSTSSSMQHCIKLLWEFLTVACMSNGPRLCAILTEHFNSKPLIPTNDNRLFPIMLSKAVLCVKPHTKSHVWNALNKLGYPTLDFTPMGLGHQPHIDQLVVSPLDAHDVVKCLQLQEPLNVDTDLTEEEVDQLIQAFINYEIESIIPTLRQMRLYKNVYDQFVSLSTTQSVIIMPSEIPCNGIGDMTEAVRDCLILKASDKFISSFYETVVPNYNDMAVVSTVQFYTQIILPNLHDMDTEAVVEHIHFIFQRKDEVEYEPILEILRDSRFINQHLPSNFYSPDVEFFKTFQNDSLLPEPWRRLLRKQGWLLFFKQLGLKCEVTAVQWLSQANSFALDARKVGINALPLQALVKRSDILLESFMEIIKTMNELQGNKMILFRFLNEASTIHFMYSQFKSNVKQLLLNFLSKQPCNKYIPQHSYFISFSGSVFHYDADLAGLCQTVLTKKCQEIPLKCTILNTELRIETPVSLQTVCKNLARLSAEISSCCTQIHSDSLVKVVHELKVLLVMHYEHLQNLQATKTLLVDLQTEQCLLLNDPQTLDGVIQLVKPFQLVKQIPSTCELQPFRYKVPPHLMKFDHLLSELGVADELNSQLCAEILFEINQEVGDGEVISEAYLRAAESAYSTLVKCLRHEDHEVSFSHQLYLVSEDSKLLKASDMYHNDVPWYASRLKSTQYTFVKQPPPDDTGQRSLPSALKVIPFSCIVTEQLHSDMNSSELKCHYEELFETKRTNSRCQIILNLLQTLQSHELFEGICRIYFHECQQVPTGEFMECATDLQHVKIKCNQGTLRTILFHGGQPISGTADNSILCHLSREDGQTLLYIAPHGDDSQYQEDKFLKQLSAAIARLLKGKIRNEAHIAGVFQCDPTQIPQVLDGLRVTPYDPKNVIQSKYHQIGETVSKEKLYHQDLLIVVNYSPGDMVIYHSNDDDTFRYAKVLKSNIPQKVYDCIATIQVSHSMCTSDADAEESHLEVTPLQLHKLFTKSQRAAMASSQGNTLATPLSLVEVPCKSINDIEEWMEETLQSQLVQNMSVCSVQLTILRLIAQMHYQLVVRQQGRALFTQAIMALQNLVCQIPLPSSVCDPDNDPPVTRQIQHITEQMQSLCLEHEGDSDSDDGDDDDDESSVNQQAFSLLTEEMRQPSLLPSGEQSEHQPSTPPPVTVVHNASPIGVGISTPQAPSTFLPSPRRFVNRPRGHRHTAPVPTAIPSRFRCQNIPTQPQPQPPQTSMQSAQMWFDQAKADFGAACSLFQLPLSPGKLKQDNKDDLLPSPGSLHIESDTDKEQPGLVDEIVGAAVEAPAQSIAGDDDVLGEEEVKSKVPSGKSSDQCSMDTCPFPAQVCLLCHDAVEKCLKAVAYAYCGLSQGLLNSSQLVPLLQHLKSSTHCPSQLKEPLEECVMLVNVHENKSRYPNFQIPPCAPAVVYRPLHAREALTAVSAMLNKLKCDDRLKELLGDIHQLPKQKFVSTLMACHNEEDFPESWMEHSDNEELKLVLLDPDLDEEEYDRIADSFLLTMPGVTSLRIDRIQNKPIWKKYCDYSRHMLLDGNGVLGEKVLFHGSRSTDPQKIYRGNISFDPQFSHDGMWGRGSYFAENASYSDHYAYHGSSGKRKIFAAWVLTGLSYTSPPQNYRQPPERPESGGITRRYDSVNGVTGGSKVYITYQSSLAYPAYLITYIVQ